MCVSGIKDEPWNALPATCGYDDEWRCSAPADVRGGGGGTATTRTSTRSGSSWSSRRRRNATAGICSSESTGSDGSAICAVRAANAICATNAQTSSNTN